jgi:inorganic pyrophosphatase
VTKGTRAKFEMSKETVYNPVFSDVNIKKDTGAKQLRKYGVPAIFNYGFIPQTWEDNRTKNGDGDPIDLIDVGQHPDTAKPILAVCDYLVLGCLGLID